MTNEPQSTRNPNITERLAIGQQVTMAGYPGSVIELYSDGPCEGGRMYNVRLASGVGCYCGSDLIPVKTEAESDDEAKAFDGEELREFTGTENYYRTSFPGVVLTDGTKYLAERAGAYWLMDIIASVQLLKKVRAEGFQTWKIIVDDKKHRAVVTCDDGNGNIVYTQNVQYTDFPLNELVLYAIWTEQRVIMLTSEY